MFCTEREVSPGLRSVCSAACNLADDAPWKKIQKNTFTRWCNEHLRRADRVIDDLRFDLNDGLTLIALLEVLSHKKISRKYHTRPTFRQMRLDNVSVALEFLEQENIKLVSIDSKAIVDGNMKLILGLVWTLILHYSISSSLLEEEEAKKQTPELRLLGWIQDKVPELPITNFSQDWMDGKALGALVDGLAPGLCPDWESWDEVQRVDNAREAMQQAAEWLGVPQDEETVVQIVNLKMRHVYKVIAPEEIIDPSVDELSIMTYLSMFPKAQLKPGAPLKPKSVSKPKVCRASGRGLQPRGVREGQVADFKVDTSKAGPGHLEVHVRGPDGFDVPVKQKQATGDVYSFQYEPNVPGMHTISIMWAGEHIFKSPFEVGVGPKAGPQMIRAWGPGLVHGMAEMSADFVVESTGANFGLLGFAIEGPSQARIECGDQEDGSCNVRFWPTKTGEYAVHVMCDEEEIQDSPFMSYISPNKKKCYPHKVKVFGPGVSQNGFILNSLMEFTVDARFAGHGSLGIQAQSIEGRFVDVAVMRKEHGLYTCFYTPATLTKHTVFVTWGGVSVPGSPFRVKPERIRFEPLFNTPSMKSTGSDENGEDMGLNLAEITATNPLFKIDLNVTSPKNLPADANKVKAYGPGLEGGLVGTLAAFTIDTNDSGCGQLSVTVDGPCPTKIMCSDNQDGTCTVTYLPTENGEHSINIFFQGLHIPGSPFHVDIQAPFDLSKVVVSGPGLKTGKVGEPCVVNIDCALAGLGDLSVEAVSESGQPANAKVQANKDGTYTVVYVPLTAGVYTLRLKYGGKLLANFPSEVIVDPAIYTSQVKICGNGADAEGVGEQNHFEGEQNPASAFAKGIGLLQGLTGESKQFTITKRGRGAGGLSVSAEGPSDAKVSCPGSIDGVYDVQYSPSVPGLYNVNVTCGGEHVQGSPFKDPVKEVSDKSDVKIWGPGLETGVCAQTPQTFTIDCSKTGETPQSVAVMTPSGKIEVVEVKDNCDGTYSMAYSPSVEGDHCLVVKYTDDQAFSSPVAFQVLPAKDVDKVKVSVPVPELESRVCAQIPQTFTIDCSKNGEAPETVAVMTPDGKMELVEVTDNRDGTYSVVYSPSMEGAHSLVVRNADEDEFCRDGTHSIAYSPSMEGAHSLVVKYTDGEEFYRPFNVKVLPNNAKKHNVSGPRLESQLSAKVPQTFTIYSSQTGEAPESEAIMAPSGKMGLAEVMDRDGTYSLAYSPSVEGDHSLVVTRADEDDYVSSYQLQVLPNDSNSEVKISVPELESRICAQIPQTFTIDCSKTGEPPQSVAIMTPSGVTEVVKVADNGDGTYSVAYSPSVEGAHSLTVRYADEEEFSILSNFRVLPTNDTNKLNVCGPGLEMGLCAKVPQTFSIDCSKTGGAPESVAVMTPNGKMELVEVIDNRDGTYSMAYSPSMEGVHSLVVKYSDEDEFCSPYQFQVLSGDSNREVKVSVPGPEAGVCAQIPQTFTIDCNKTGEAPETVAVMTPSGKMEISEVIDNGDGTYSVAFFPSMEGAHSVMVKYNDDEDFYCFSSFNVLPIDDVNKLKVSAPGLESGLCEEGPQSFTNDCSKIEEAPGSVALNTPSGKMELSEVTDNENVISPTMEGSQSVMVKYANEEDVYSPHNFQALLRNDNGKVEISVPELESGFCAQIPQTFTIDCSKTGETPQAVAIMTPSGQLKFLEVTDNGNGTYSVAYSPTMNGAHLIMVKYAEEAEFNSSSSFQVVPTSGIKELKVSGPGLESGLCVKLPQTFTIGCSNTGGAPESVAVITPSGKMELVEVSDNRDGTYSVAYSPSKEGAHSLVVKYAEEEQFYSPYNFHVLPTGDANSGIESGSGPESKTCAKVTQTFTIDCSKTGEAPAMVVPHECLGKVELVEVKHREDGKHQVERSPSTDGSHTLEVTHADEDEYRRPFHFRALSLHAARKVRVGGPGLVSGLPASMPVRFSVDPAEAGEGQLSVEIVDPEGRSKKARIHDNNDGTYEVSYVPSKVGGYKITIKYNGDEIPTSPYHVWATATGDANKCIVTGPKLGSVIGAGKEISFVVNTQSAGMGKVSCFVLTPDGTEVEADVIEREDGTFEICYIANKEGNYIISAGFGGERLFSSPFEVVVRDAQDENVDHHGQVSKSKHQASSRDDLQPMMTHGSYIPLRSVDQTNGLMPFDIVMAFGLAGGKIMGEVQMPSGSRAQAEVTDNKDGTVTLMYDPIEEGLHQLHIKVNGTTVSESPLQFYVNNASNRELMAHGPGLVYGVSNEIAAFTVFNKDLVQGELDIALEGPSKTEIRCLNNKDGICTVTYLPTVPGDYNIFVRYNDKDIQGSPFTAKIAGPCVEVKGDVSRLSSQLRFGTVADFSLDITEEDISLLSASIVSPSGQDVSCILKTQPDNHLGISFIPKEVGKHLVSVLKDGEHVADSPIPLTITPLEIGDANRVKVLGSGLAKGCTFETSSFVVDTREAGYGGLTLAIEGPSNVEIQTEEKEDGTCGVSFCPTEAGTYIVSVKFTDEHVPGSPFKAVVTESGHLRESITHYQGAATIANVGNTCEINLKIPGLDLQHISADVSSPSGSIKEATVTIIGCDIYSVSFLPEERGTHAVSVHYKGQPIPGGPYRYTVGPLGEGGPEKVQAWGQGLQSAKTSIPADFSIWSREAGAGSLSVTMDGPGKAELGFEDRKDGSCGISYIVTNPGDYEVSVKFNDEHIQHSPFLVPVFAPVDDALGQNAHHQMNRLNNASIISSPWPSFLSDASKVASSGQGLRRAFIGTQNVFNVDCSKAGTNLLLVGMHGPTIPCEQVSIIHLGNNHYDVSYVVKEKGSYVLEVKWGQEHIPGSPFYVIVS